MLVNVVADHEEGEIACPSCEEQFGPCSCGGIVHCEYQPTIGRFGGAIITEALLVLECDRCDEYEIE